MTTTVIERTARSKVSTAEAFALMARIADWRRVDGSHWQGTHGGKPAAFVLDEPRLLRIEQMHGLSARALRHHLRRLAELDLAHLCKDGHGRKARLVTLFPVERAERPCPGCRPELITDERRRSNRQTSSVKPTNIVGYAAAKTADDQRESTAAAGKSQLGKSYEETSTTVDKGSDPEGLPDLASMPSNELAAFAAAKAALDPAGTDALIAKFAAELDELGAAARNGGPVDHERYFALDAELRALEEARAS
jgi:hypothetical protein